LVITPAISREEMVLEVIVVTSLSATRGRLPSTALVPMADVGSGPFRPRSLARFGFTLSWRGRRSGRAGADRTIGRLRVRSRSSAWRENR
jgi:hypothetical protein